MREATLVSGLRAEAVQGSQVPRSVLSRERLLVFRGDTGLGGLLRLELLDAVECLGESESSPSQSLAGASLPWSMPPDDSEPSDGEGRGWRLAPRLPPDSSLCSALPFCAEDLADRPLLALMERPGSGRDLVMDGILTEPLNTARLS